MSDLNFSEINKWKSSTYGEYLKVSDSSGVIWQGTNTSWRDCSWWNPNFVLALANTHRIKFSDIIPLVISGSDYCWIYDTSRPKSIASYRVECDVKASSYGGSFDVEVDSENPRSRINLLQPIADKSLYTQYYMVDSTTLYSYKEMSYIAGDTFSALIERTKQNSETIMKIGSSSEYDTATDSGTVVSSDSVSCGYIKFGNKIMCSTINMCFQCVDGTSASISLIPITNGSKFGFRSSTSTIDQINAGTARIFCEIGP